MSFIKIYFGDRPLIISDNDDESFFNSAVRRVDSIASARDTMKEDGFEQAVILTDDIGSAKNTIFKDFKIIQAGGGIVINRSGEILLIYRNGHWDLPKGKLDDQETIGECALREVREETGLSGLSIIKPVAISYHVYSEKGKDILKEGHWFLMDYSGSESLKPQTEEDIEKALWVNPAGFNRYYPEMYSLIKDILSDFV